MKRWLMKTINSNKTLAIMAVTGLVAVGSNAGAQSATTTTSTNLPLSYQWYSGSTVAQSTPTATAPSTATSITAPATAAPQLSYGVAQILQLTQAKVSDDTVVAYVKNSGNSYGLDANQIIYLRQQGVS